MKITYATLFEKSVQDAEGYFGADDTIDDLMKMVKKVSPFQRSIMKSTYGFEINDDHILVDPTQLNNALLDATQALHSAPKDAANHNLHLFLVIVHDVMALA